MKSISEQLLDNMFKAKRQIQQNQYPLISDEDYKNLRSSLRPQDTRWIDDQIKCLNSKKYQIEPIEPTLLRLRFMEMVNYLSVLKLITHGSTISSFIVI